ncbi:MULTISPECIES: translesion error-prone DNA polymerase V subunit UmuC [unclassified Neptuniibacter]|uniref:translesion error-prone DNA polymerase V subunit UmuC n=1 Tax=unclassified Neptuniibacter TaxID=2630693 RepID=UPI000C5647EE|nr:MULTISPECIES: translesion error-prone DNA polymerase V subunit UmuC [unclassified Neptuniibacter]MAY40746.1 DNA polymerase V subunit UmuC [Oceanospirillaceae bacterium]|tara:strand:+ start:6967 stop:8229 length:1263 start_codon:yes stop_codon:yes gene_type:complete
MYALVDCNNFYVSCERLFRPELNGKAVVVLSNNDGCIISRSAEAKAMGIKMASPYFQVREHVDRGDLHVFSSNYALYGDLSARVMEVLDLVSPQVEVYSIDEAFLNLQGMERMIDLDRYGQEVKAQVFQWTGLPVCVGIAPTKTLAKLANYAAKHFPQSLGVVNLSKPGWRERLLQRTPVEEVWGVGRRSAVKLKIDGIHTAEDLANSDAETMRSRYSVVLERTILELRGVSCIGFEGAPEARQQILCSRTFSSRITRRQPLEEAVREYAVRAAEKLRQDQQVASHMAVSIRTNPNAQFEPRYRNTASVKLPTPTSDSRILIKQAVLLLRTIYKSGYRYMKAGVVLSELQPAGNYQSDMFCEDLQSGKSVSLMQTLDAINQRYPRGVTFAGQGVTQDWAMQRKFLSPRYTSNWQELPKVR